MNSFATILKLDFNATFRSRWFWVYAVLVIASMGGIFATGISDSRVAGFTGLTRPLLIFIQGCNLVLPIFVLVSTVRTLVKEKESNIFEYELSYFSGRILFFEVPLQNRHSLFSIAYRNGPLRCILFGFRRFYPY